MKIWKKSAVQHIDSDECDIPDGWSKVNFFDFCVLQRGYDLPIAKSVEGPFPIVTSAGIVAYHNECKVEGPGVCTGRSGSIGNVYYIEKDFWPHNTSLYVKDFKGNYPKFVYYFLRFFDPSQYSASTAVPTMNRNNLREIDVIVPPLPEQERIVARIEALLAHVNEARGQLQRVPEMMKQFRQGVLAEACSGRLTEGWREQHSDEKPVQLPKTSNKKETEKFLENLHILNELDFPQLPDNWVWSNGLEIFPVITSGSRGWAKYYSEKGPSFIRIGNLTRDSISLDLKEIQKVNPPDTAERKRIRVEKNDILISITADIGSIGYVSTDIGEAYINQHIALCRPVNQINANFIALYLLNKEGGKKQLLELQRGATKIGLGLDDIRAVQIPLPPLTEQHEIVHRVDALFARADIVEREAAAATKRAEALTQAVLAKAFSGKL